MTKQEFISKYKAFALESEAKTGIKASFILAQAALESGWGQSAPGNMFFGVKAKPGTPENKRQLLITHEVLSDDKQGGRFPQVLSITRRSDGKYNYKVKDWFRKYDTPEECFTDHCKFFYENKRYAAALTVMNNPYKFAEQIAKAGYATAPDYAASLKQLIKSIEEVMK